MMSSSQPDTPQYLHCHNATSGSNDPTTMIMTNVPPPVSTVEVPMRRIYHRSPPTALGVGNNDINSNVNNNNFNTSSPNTPPPSLSSSSPLLVTGGGLQQQQQQQQQQQHQHQHQQQHQLQQLHQQQQDNIMTNAISPPAGVVTVSTTTTFGGMIIQNNNNPTVGGSTQLLTTTPANSVTTNSSNNNNSSNNMIIAVQSHPTSPQTTLTQHSYDGTISNLPANTTTSSGSIFSHNYPSSSISSTPANVSSAIQSQLILGGGATTRRGGDDRGGMSLINQIMMSTSSAASSVGSGGGTSNAGSGGFVGGNAGIGGASGDRGGGGGGDQHSTAPYSVSSSKSTGSGNSNSYLLQMAFPTAEFAMQQEILLQQQGQFDKIRQEQEKQQQQLQQQQQQQQQHHQQHQHQQIIDLLASSPWTLGSTDGSYAQSWLVQHQHSTSTTNSNDNVNSSTNSNQRYTPNGGRIVTGINNAGGGVGGSNGGEGGGVGVGAGVGGGATITRSTGEAVIYGISDAGGVTDKNSVDGIYSINSNTNNNIVNGEIEVDATGNQSDEMNDRPWLQPQPQLQQLQREQQQNNYHQQHGLQQNVISRGSNEYFNDTSVPRGGNHDSAFVISKSSMNAGVTIEEALKLVQEQKSLYQERLFRQPSSAVEACLAAACEVMSFDIAEMWLRTGVKTHQLTNSHLRPTALDDSVRKELVDVYYGERSNERTHRLSPALCKRAKEANDVVWVTSHNNPTSAEALRCSISNVRTAVAVPVCHQTSNTNITILFFSIRRIVVRPTSVEFLVHMALGAGVASINSLAEDGAVDKVNRSTNCNSSSVARSDPYGQNLNRSVGSGGGSLRQQVADLVSVTGAPLNLNWRVLSNVEYLTDGGNSWIHTAVYQTKPVVVKTLKPECQDVAVAINEIEGELSIHSRLDHPNIVQLLGAGLTSKGVRFFVLERLDGGTLTQMLGYETRIRDRRRRFWRKKLFSFIDVLRIARSIAEAMTYCHERAIPGSVVMHRDLKPDNIGFSLDGTVKILDFGLAKIIDDANVDADEVYHMSGETGSLRYMAPEVADGLPYNHSADVYSFGIILWELNATKKPYEGLNRELFYERIVHGGERPPLSRKWPVELTSLMSECWDADMFNRPKFRDIVRRIDSLLLKERGGGTFGPSTGNSGVNASHRAMASGGGVQQNSTQNGSSSKDSKTRKFLPKITGMIDRHSSWF